MIVSSDGREVQTGDHVAWANHLAVVEQIIKPGEEQDRGIDGPGFWIVSEGGDRLLVEPDGPDWENLTFLHRAG